MNFDNSQPIWLQIYELILSRIASTEWAEDERIPSVRELGATLVVNPNTVMRTYERLTDEGLIYNRRGIGYFVAYGAKARAAEIVTDHGTIQTPIFMPVGTAAAMKGIFHRDGRAHHICSHTHNRHAKGGKPRADSRNRHCGYCCS